MYKIEIDRFNKKIDEQRIYPSSKRALHHIVEKFFYTDYSNISKGRKSEVEEDFKIECIMIKSKYYKSDVNKVEEIISQIENSLFTILDKSVDKSKSDNSSINIKEKISKSIMLKPNFHGVGIDLEKLLKK